MSVITQLLKKTHLFAGVADEHIDAIAEFSSREVIEPKYNENVMVLKKNQDHPSLRLVVSGHVSLEKRTEHDGIPSNAQQDVESLEDEVLGEISWVMDQPRLADVFTANRAVLVRIDGFQFTLYLDENPELGYHIYKRIAYVMGKRVTANFKKAEQRDTDSGVFAW
ncbi:MAG: Crp/Fnr family transcriptional regulator [Magnetococcales bacterium]|nr:Crp/Fnr family transcriptional regulator [Magnetococcales bacterium]